MNENTSNETSVITDQAAAKKRFSVPATIGTSIGAALSGVAATASVFTVVLALKLIDKTK